MSLRTRKPGIPNIAFVLNEQRFRQLVALMKALTSSDDLEYTVRLSDGSSINCSSKEEVLAIQNSKLRQITSMWIESPYRSEPRIQVKLQSQTYLLPVEYEVAGNERDVFHTSARLDEYFVGLRQWFSPIVTMGHRTYFVFAAILGALSYWLQQPLGINFVEDGEVTSAYLIYLLLLLPVGYFVLMALERLRKLLFPNGTFAIGDGVDRHSNLVQSRKVIGGAILTLLLGAVGFWLYPLLF